MEILSRIRVLLVFPDDGIMSDVAAALAASDEPVETGRAHSFADAMDALVAAPFDMVLSSLRLPDGEPGSIPLRFPMIPCIAVGEPSESAALDAALETGLVDYVLAEGDWTAALGPYLHRIWRIRRRLAVDMGYLSKRYQDLVEALPDIVYELDLEGRFSFVNQSVRMLGYAPEELIGQHFSVMLFEEDVPHVSRDQVLKLYEKNRTGARNAPKLFDERRGVDRKTENLELRIQRKAGTAPAGSEVIASVISYGEIAAAGAYRSVGERKEKVFVGTVGIIRDITLRRKSEDMLRKMYQAVDQSPVSVAILDRDLNIEYVNPSFFGLTGTGPDQAIGRKIGEFLGAASDPATYEDLTASVRAGIDWTGELRCPRVAQDPFWSSVLVSAIRAPAGIITHFLCLLEDVTRKRALDELLKQAKEAAEETSRAKSEFLANMSHELRTPLAGVISLTDVLMADHPRLAQKDRLKAIRVSASSLLDMLNDLLDLSKIEARAVVLKPEDFDLTEWASAVLAPFTALAEEKGLSFAHRIDDGGIPKINTDKGRVSQIVSNLTSNAVKFSSEGGIDVRFSVRAKDGMPALFVSVRDTGIGISGVDQQKLFKHFSQVDASLSKQYGGTGLGLAISKELALKLGGDVWVESSPGVGSTFSFYVPVKIAGEVVEAAQEDFLPAPRPLALLVAEDNPVNRDYLRFFLEKAGHRVVLVSDGYEALAALENGDYDAILMDIQMAGMDGISATTTIRSYTGTSFDSRIPVIALTAFGVEDLGVEFKNAGFDAHATKPINARSLVALIDETVRKKERFDLEKIRRQHAASADEFKRLLMVAFQDLPKRMSEFEKCHGKDDQEGAVTALQGAVTILSGLGAVRALQLVKRYRKALKQEDENAAMLAVEDLTAEISSVRRQVRKGLSEL